MSDQQKVIDQQFNLMQTYRDFTFLPAKNAKCLVCVLMNLVHVDSSMRLKRLLALETAAYLG